MTKTPAADIVERLVIAAHECALIAWSDEAATCLEGSAEITRLRAREDELQRKLDEALKMLDRWQNWSCGQRGGSPFLDTRRTLDSIRGEG